MSSIANSVCSWGFFLGGALLGALLAARLPKSLRLAVARVLAENWPNERAQNWQPPRKAGRIQEVYEQLRAPAPEDEEHWMMQSEALGLPKNLAQLRRLIIEQTSATILIFWITSILVSWGRFSRANATSVATFLVAVLCVSGAIFLVLEIYTPGKGLLRLSSAPLRVAYDFLAR